MSAYPTTELALKNLTYFTQLKGHLLCASFPITCPLPPSDWVRYPFVGLAQECMCIHSLLYIITIKFLYSSIHLVFEFHKDQDCTFFLIWLLLPFFFFWLLWVFVAVCGLSLVMVSSNFIVSKHGLLIAVASLVAYGLSCPLVCGIFLDQWSNPCPPHWQEDY